MAAVEGRPRLLLITKENQRAATLPKGVLMISSLYSCPYEAPWLSRGSNPATDLQAQSLLGQDLKLEQESPAMEVRNPH